MTEITQDHITRAWQFATEKHTGQLYAGKFPYIFHLGAVALELQNALLTSPVPDISAELALCAAILHDTVEDTDATHREVEELFGGQVARIVSALTKNKQLSKKERLADSVRRIKMCEKEAWLVKLADRVANTNTVRPGIGRDWILNYIVDSEYILEELGRTSDRLARRLQSNINKWKQADYAGLDRIL